MMRRPALTLVALCGLAIAACGADRTQTTATTIAEPARAVDVSYANVAGDYAKASQDLLQRGRSVVDRLVAGDIAAVYEQFSPEVKDKFPLVEMERSVAEERAKAPIGPRLEERVIPFGPTRGVYFADHDLR